MQISIGLIFSHSSMGPLLFGPTPPIVPLLDSLRYFPNSLKTSNLICGLMCVTLLPLTFRKTLGFFLSFLPLNPRLLIWIFMWSLSISLIFLLNSTPNWNDLKMFLGNHLDCDRLSKISFDYSSPNHCVWLPNIFST